MGLFKNKNVIPFIQVVGKDKDAGNLNGMPDGNVIEQRALLREAAREALKGLAFGSKKARGIRQALAGMDDADFSADQAAECNERHMIRERRI